MYVGHGLLAFALVGAVARLAERDDRDVLLLATLGAGYGLLPDIDLVYTVYAVAESGPTGIFPTTEHVWTESWVIHRTLTHSLFVGCALVLVVVGIGTAMPQHLSGQRSQSNRALGGTLAGLVAIGLLWIASAADGALGAITMTLLVSGVAGLGVFGRQYGISVPWIGSVASLGLLSHPPGDLWMGRPPIVFYPFLSECSFPAIVFASDPTVNFVMAFLIEVLLAWASLQVWALSTDRTLTRMVRPVALFGITAVVAVLFLPPPTFLVAYQFSASVLGLGIFAGASTLVVEEIEGTSAPRGAQDLTDRWSGLPQAVVTGLATISIALVSYLFVYLVFLFG
jgi:hypothetical protein